MLFIGKVTPNENSSIHELIDVTNEHLKTCTDGLLYGLPPELDGDIKTLFKAILDKPEIAKPNRFNLLIKGDTTYVITAKTGVKDVLTLHGITLTTVGDEVKVSDHIYVGIKTTKEILDSKAESMLDLFNSTHLGIHAISKSDDIESILSVGEYDFNENIVDHAFDTSAEMFYDILYKHANLLTPEYVVKTFHYPDRPFETPTARTVDEIKFYKALNILHNLLAGNDTISQLLIDLNRAHRDQQERLERIKLFIHRCEEARSKS